MSAALTGRVQARKATPARVGLTTIRGRVGRPRRVQIITTARWDDARIAEKRWNMPAPERGSKVENESSRC